MPMFCVKGDKLSAVGQRNFPSEKVLQRLIEKNLDAVFSCRLVASEHPTGARHSGRIDTLALSEDNNPVIIEYKKSESSDLINQSLFYLEWIHDHRGDFEIAAQRAIGHKIVVDWSGVRVICIAPNYRRYDLHAVRVMGANLELWTYRLFENNSLYLEEVFQKSEDATVGAGAAKHSAAKKSAATRATGVYSFEEHVKGVAAETKDLAVLVNDFVTGLDPSIEVVPKKFYVAYKTSQNILCMVVQKKRVFLYLKLDPKTAKGPLGLSRDVSGIGHYGTGNLEVTVSGPADLDRAKPFIETAYQQVGG